MEVRALSVLLTLTIGCASSQAPSTAAPQTSTHTAAPIVDAGPAAETCSVVGQWSSAAASVRSGLFRKLTIETWDDRLLVDHDGRINAVLMGTLHERVLAVTIRPLPGAAAAPDAKAPHAKPATKRDPGVLVPSDPEAYRCTLLPDCVRMDCTLADGFPFHMDRGRETHEP